jgi:predicted secreted protein
MQWTSALAIYVLFWWLCIFLVLPFHARRARDNDEPHVPGQADSAPARFSFGKVALQVSLLAAVFFGVYYLNYVNGWLTMNDVNPLPPPPSR